MALFIVHKGRQISNEKLSLSKSGFKHILSRYFFRGETLSDGKLQQHFSFGIEYFHLKYVLLLLNHHYRCTYPASEPKETLDYLIALKQETPTFVVN